MSDGFADRALLTRRKLLQLAMAAPAAGSLGLGAPAIARSAESDAKLPIGMNLSGIADWQPGYPFLNLMWGARPWLTKNLSGQGPWNTPFADSLELDPDGYPLEVPFKPDGALERQYVFTILPNTLKQGTYVVLHDGEGAFEGAAGTRVVSTRPGRAEIVMQHRSRDVLEVLSIRRSVRGNHIRNVRVVPIEHEQADLDANPFRPEVIEFCKPWHCLRFMDWLGTNNSIDRRWADRKRRTFYTQIGTTGDTLGLFGNPIPAWERKWASGIAVELCIQLANLTRKDAWLCVPHMADDEYITQMAKVVKAELDPSLKVYLEFSNEIWNWQFQQAQWMIRSEVAGTLVEAGGGRRPWKGWWRPTSFKDGVIAPGAGEGIDHPERTGALFRRCFKLWEDVFAGADRKRLVRVCAVQAGWTDTVRRTLGWVMKHGGCDALSPSGYFGPDDSVYARWEAAGARLTPDDVIADMQRMVAGGVQTAEMNARLAREAGVRLVVYEGGQHIQPKSQADTPYNPALGAAQTHPSMYALYRKNLELFARTGCDLFCAFNSVGAQGSRFGSWGHVERYGQSPAEAPKYRALLDGNASRTPA